ncbi:NAD-dependent succinate-semialdehyde dehydrogenase [Calidithermus timidus]|jgi:succinate-semialdehyde dehydrogenase/glutarate-semialdehyde dehydrogenase|uniref:NAD-dependent succinate-semialdehyde dehydrogenase n=1 Tax=Calidithermus timidus TaxID=307124 RepID=UPI0004761BF3|nr:NAD-dependent succinate-semialdehyde dehydrogenase [Calidithermus timidus]
MIKELPNQAYFADGWQSTGKTFSVTHPGDGHIVGEVADCGPAEARRAIEAALEAFEGWKRTNPYTRAEILERWNELLLAHEAELGRLMSLEMGKPITESRGEVRYSASFVKWYAQEAVRLHGERVLSRFDHKRGLVSYEPVGVVYAVTPWNFPTGMITRKAAPALAAGCAIVIKPAEQSPMSALYLARLWEEAGGPKGTLQVLPTSDPVAFSQPFFEDERVRKLTFTGSTEVGRLLYAQAAKTLKRVSLELGGHAPFLVFEDADLDKAARDVVLSKFRNAGQTCICTNRVFVQQSVLEPFTQAFAAATAALRLGDPLLPETQVGPVVDAQGLAKVKEHIEDALAKGAKAVVGGKVREGLYFEPTVLSGVRPGMKIMTEETFGPVAPVIPFTTEEEALRLANDTPYGLAAYAWTNDLSRAWRVAEGLHYGIVGINDPIPTAMAPQAPFGGMKNSGLGREGGWWGLEEYLEAKFISMSIADGR